jgi:hypothetical protein
MKTYGGVEVQLQHSRLRHQKQVSGQLHAPAALPPGNHPRYPLERRLGGPQSRSGRCGEENNLALSGIEPWPSSSTELSRLFQYTFSLLKFLTVFGTLVFQHDINPSKNFHQLCFFSKQTSRRNDKHLTLPFIFLISGKDLCVKKWVWDIRGCRYRHEGWNCLVNSSYNKEASRQTRWSQHGSERNLQ